MRKWMPWVICLLTFGLSSQLFAAETRKATAASYVELGDQFASAGDFNRAIKTYGIALQFDPDYAPAYFRRGLARQDGGDLSGAVADFSRTLEIMPQCAEAYANR